MAGDWIKIRNDLYEDQSVMNLSDILGTDDPTTVGLLVRFWSWTDRQTTDGNNIAVTSARIDRLVGRSGFADGLRQIGWLEGDDGSLSLPRFDRHNGSSAKARALEAEAKRIRRLSDTLSDKCPTNEVENVGPEKRREEKKDHTHTEARGASFEIPTLEDVKAHARSSMVGITEECAEKFWNENDSIGWIYKGQPIQNWRPLLNNYARTWNLNERKGKSGKYEQPKLDLKNQKGTCPW